MVLDEKEAVRMIESEKKKQEVHDIMDKLLQDPKVRKILKEKMKKYLDTRKQLTNPLLQRRFGSLKIFRGKAKILL
ncbi:MAG: hypothetical protein U9O89_02440 [Thermoproteota archaeon]|nr:hypothetical protein [Thermoproteota archaeon]